MHKIDTEYLDKYDELNRLCRKVTGGTEGVTGYINAMADIKDGAEKVSFWNEDMETLKRLRALYTQVSQEDTERNIYSSIKDIQAVETFYSRIKQGQDPLSMVGKKKLSKKPSVGTIVLITVLALAVAAWIIMLVTRF